jgi:uncharacterized protein (DUF3820 family)
LWFTGKGFPEGELGRLLQLALEFPTNGLKSLRTPLTAGNKKARH